MPICRRTEAKILIIQAAGAALRDLVHPDFRAVFWKSIGIALTALVLAWLALQNVFGAYVVPFIEASLPAFPEWAGWLGFVALILAGIGFALVLALAMAPITAMVAGIFLDDVAETIERTHYAAEPPGTALPMGRALVLALKFLGIVLAGNVLALLLLLVPGVNLVAFFLVNGYLLGREFFEFAAMRFRPEAEAKALRRRHAGRVLLAGLLIAGFLAIPVVNLATPLFAAALMVHLHKAIAGSQARRTGSADG